MPSSTVILLDLIKGAIRARIQVAEIIATIKLNTDVLQRIVV